MRTEYISSHINFPDCIFFVPLRKCSQEMQNSHITFRLQLRIKPLECPSLTSFQRGSPFGGGPPHLGVKHIARFSRITFRFSQITFRCVSLHKEKRHQTFLENGGCIERKIYVRKSAVYTAQQYSCSEFLSENGEI